MNRPRLLAAVPLALSLAALAPAAHAADDLVQPRQLVADRSLPPAQIQLTLLAQDGPGSPALTRLP